MTTILIENMHVYDANLSGGLVTDGLSISALIGFATALKKNLNDHFDLDLENIHNVSVLPILHSIDAEVGRKIHEQGKPQNGNYQLVELTEATTGSVNLSLLIDFNEHLDLDTIEDDVLEVLPTRLSGGVISEIATDGNLSPYTVKEITALTPEVFTKSGFILSQSDEEYRPIYADDIADFVSILDIISPRTSRQHKGWLVPLQIGFRLIGSPSEAKPKLGTRISSMKHMFATSLLSLGEYISTNNRRIRNLNSEEIKNLFWGWHEFEFGGASYKIFSRHYEGSINSKSGETA